MIKLCSFWHQMSTRIIPWLLFKGGLIVASVITNVVLIVSYHASYITFIIKINQSIDHDNRHHHPHHLNTHHNKIPLHGACLINEPCFDKAWCSVSDKTLSEATMLISPIYVFVHRMENKYSHFPLHYRYTKLRLSQKHRSGSVRSKPMKCFRLLSRRWPSTEDLLALGDVVWISHYLSENIKVISRRMVNVARSYKMSNQTERKMLINTSQHRSTNHRFT